MNRAQWLDSLLKCIPQDELLDWALNSTDMRLADAQSFMSEERITTILTTQAARHGLNLVFRSPFTSINLALAATTGILLADLVARNAQLNLLKGDVLLITRQIGVGVAELSHLRLGKVVINQIWQVQSALRRTETRDTGHPQVLVASPQPSKLAEIGRKVDSVVIDATHPLTLERLEEIVNMPSVQEARRRVLVVPLGYQPEFLDDNWITWAWDFKAINTCRLHLNGKTTPWLEEWHRTFVVSNDNSTDSLLGRAREKLGFLSRQIGPFPPTVLQIAWGIYNRLSNLCVPLGLLEETAFHHHYARTIRDRLQELTAFDYSQVPVSNRAVWASEWRPLLESLNQAYQNLKGDHPAKFWSIAYLVDARIHDGFNRPLLVICPTQMEGNILTRELGKTVDEVYEYLHPEGLIIATPRHLAEIQGRWNYEIVCTGTLLSRWRYLNTTVSEAIMLAYPHEIQREQNSLSNQVRSVLEVSSMAARATALAELKLCKAPESEEVELDEHRNVQFTIVDPEGLPERHDYRVVSPVELNSLTSPNWAWDAADLEYVAPVQIAHQASSSVQPDTSDSLCTNTKVRLTLSNGENWLVPGDQPFDVFRIVTEELEELPAIELRAGDILIIVDDSNYGRLFERIVEALEQHPQFVSLSVWLNIWELAKHSALDKAGNSYTNLHASLEEIGFSITEQAVRSWFHGVMGPRDEDMVFAIIDFSQFKPASSHKQQIRSAVGHIRGMHRAAGRRIRQLVKQTAIERETETDINDVVNIAVEDVLSASMRIVVREVVIVED